MGNRTVLGISLSWGKIEKTEKVSLLCLTKIENLFPASTDAGLSAESSLPDIFH